MNTKDKIFNEALFCNDMDLFLNKYPLGKENNLYITERLSQYIKRKEQMLDHKEIISKIKKGSTLINTIFNNINAVVTSSPDKIMHLRTDNFELYNYVLQSENSNVTSFDLKKPKDISEKDQNYLSDRLFYHRCLSTVLPGCEEKIKATKKIMSSYGMSEKQKNKPTI